MGPTSPREILEVTASVPKSRAPPDSSKILQAQSGSRAAWAVGAGSSRLPLFPHPHPKSSDLEEERKPVWERVEGRTLARQPGRRAPGAWRPTGGRARTCGRLDWVSVLASAAPGPEERPPHSKSFWHPSRTW